MSGQFHVLADFFFHGELSLGTCCLGGWMDSASRTETVGEEGNILSLSGVEPEFLGCPALILVTIQTELI